MIDPYTPVLAFLLGLLAGWLFPSYRVRNWQWYLTRAMPCRCPGCNNWHRRGSMRFAQHRVVGWRNICQDCYNEQYHPFSKEQS